MSAPLTRLMTVPTVFSSLRVGRPTLMVTLCRSLSAISLAMSRELVGVEGVLGEPLVDDHRQ